jgi:hypothetical protein
VLLARRWAADAARSAVPAHWPLDALAATFGVQVGVVRRTIARLERFGVARRQGATVAVRLVLPPLPERLRSRLPAHLRAEYDAVLAAGVE